MTWINGTNEEPVKIPEDELQAEEEKQEEGVDQQENVNTQEPAPEENADWQDKVIIPEPASEEGIKDPEPAPITAPAATSQFSWLKPEEIDELKSRWNIIQIEFVDEPRKSVQQADALVEEVLRRIDQAFADRRSTLGANWANNEQITTEDLRVTFQTYRSFFKRFLAF